MCGIVRRGDGISGLNGLPNFSDFRMYGRPMADGAHLGGIRRLPDLNGPGRTSDVAESLPMASVLIAPNWDTLCRPPESGKPPVPEADDPGGPLSVKMRHKAHAVSRAATICPNPSYPRVDGPGPTLGRASLPRADQDQPSAVCGTPWAITEICERRLMCIHRAPTRRLDPTNDDRSRNWRSGQGGPGGGGPPLKLRRGDYPHPDAGCHNDSMKLSGSEKRPPPEDLE